MRFGPGSAGETACRMRRPTGRCCWSHLLVPLIPQIGASLRHQRDLSPGAHCQFDRVGLAEGERVRKDKSKAARRQARIREACPRHPAIHSRGYQMNESELV